MSEKNEVIKAAEKAAETFQNNLKRSSEAISHSIQNIEIDPDKITLAGMNMDYLFNSPVPGINFVQCEIENTQQKVIDDSTQMIREACYQVNVDPNILVQQAKLIADLRKALDLCGCQYVGAAFTEHMELLEENARLREMIRMLTNENAGKDDCD